MEKARLVHGRRETEVVLLNAEAANRLASEYALKVAGAFQRPDYAARVAERLGLSKQVVGLYVKKLAKAGVLDEVGEINVRGGRAKMYKTTVSGFSTVFPGTRWRRRSKDVELPEKLHNFLKPFLVGGKINGIVVVGSPHPHGPFRSVAADGHYGFQLGLFLGRFVDQPENFSVRLDVDVKSEKLYGENLLLLGGPGTNIITANVNPSLPIGFMEPNYWSGLVSPKQTYTSEFTGLVAKAPNPHDPRKTVIVCAGLRASGTKAAVLALTNHWSVLLNSYRGEERWAAVVEGLDMDGDGKIDSVEILETT
ncbi:MAG: hypothetical protein NZ919_01440 [Candidatus Caldarchaeum sp.]|nr:hypothetical protein [Candidatus Caldarchaeum sp.]